MCELFAPGLEGDSSLRELTELLPGCVSITAAYLNLLGAPLLFGALPESFSKLTERVWAMRERLPFVGAHQGLLLLRSSSSARRIQHLARNTDCPDFGSLMQPWDCQLIEFLESLLSLRLLARERSQAHLPTLKGGLGLTSVVNLAGPATVSSMIGISDLVRELLLPEAWASSIAKRDALSAKLSAFAPEAGNWTRSGRGQKKSTKSPTSSCWVRLQTIRTALLPLRRGRRLS